MKTLSVKLPDGLDARLDDMVRQRGINKSTLLREAIESYLSVSGKAKPGSFLSLSKDLAGCVKGPVDLSIHEKHMAEYGS